MLTSGEIDALFSASIPQAFLDGSACIKRLFPDYEPAERDYYRRTGIFPMMHTVVARRDLYEQGLPARRWTVEEIFDPHLLDT
jgi:hypothetical protein